ncbi:hypothetical protein ISS03_04870 [Patescibacteria group bacterium]|nr:hypothetical protein [Patescibacteria group bacterium]
MNKKNLLDIIIKEHIATGVPVGSNILVDKYKLNISPATARQRMAELESEGLIFQPHTSAGRVPTEKAYNLFVDQIVKNKISTSSIKDFDEILNTEEVEKELIFKRLAKRLAKKSKLAVFWAFHRHNLYYTGISNLLAQPEFAQLNKVYDISNIIDEIDEIIDNIYDDIKQGMNILIGSQNPFGDFCGTVLTKYTTSNSQGMFGVIGPMRMDYEKNFNLISYIYKKI